MITTLIFMYSLGFVGSLLLVYSQICDEYENRTAPIIISLLSALLHPIILVILWFGACLFIIYDEICKIIYDNRLVSSIMFILKVKFTKIGYDKKFSYVGYDNLIESFNYHLSTSGFMKNILRTYVLIYLQRVTLSNGNKEELLKQLIS